MLAEYRAGNNLADYDGGKADDDRTAAHVDVRKALILRHQAAGEGDDAIGESQAEHLHAVDVDALRRAHVGVAAGSAERGALLGAEVPVEQCNERQRDERACQDSGGNAAGGEDKRELIHADRLVRRHAHDAQVYGIERKLREYAGQYRRDAELRVEKSGAKPRKHTGNDGDQKRRPRGNAREYQHHGHSAAGGKGAVNSQICHVEQTESDVNSESHKPPYKPLRNSAGQILYELQQAE